MKKNLFLLPLILTLFFGNAQQKPLGRPLVSKIDEEVAPNITPNGQTMVFMFKDGRKPNYIICYAEKKGKEWARPVEIDPANKLPALLLRGSYCLSADGNTLLYTTKRHPSVGDYDIWMTTKNANGTWTNGENLAKPINSKMADSYPSLSVDGRTLYFSRSIASGLNKEYGGCSKLMMAKKIGDRWGTPVEVKELNTGCEVAPKILPDNETLLFASKRGGGDDFDLYISKKNEQGKWGQPIPFAPINSSEDDLFCSFSAIHDIAYFSKMSAETQDLYIAKIKDPKFQPYPINIFRYKLNENGANTASMMIQDVKTGRVLLKERISNDAYTDVYLKTGTTYEVSIMEKGYFLYTTQLDLEEEDRFNLTFNTVDLPVVKRGLEFPLAFEMDGEMVDEGKHLNELKRLAMIIDEYKGKVVMQGIYQTDTIMYEPIIHYNTRLDSSGVEMMIDSDGTILDTNMINLMREELVQEKKEAYRQQLEESLKIVHRQLKRHLKDKDKLSFDVKEAMLNELNQEPVLSLKFE